MKTKIYQIIAPLFIFHLCLISAGWSQNEPVNGYYDPVNDWFIFEWDRPDYGKTTTIYDPPNKVNPVIKAEVIFNTTTEEYIYYNYEVTNQTGAIQPLNRIFIKHLAPIYDAKMPDPQEDWDMGEYRDKSSWEWVKIGEPPAGIMAGQTERGFSFKSVGLPAIVNSAFLGERRAKFSVPGDYDTDEVEASFSRVMKAFEEKYKDKFEYVTRKTIGPKAPPADFKPVDFINYIVNMKHEAFSLGWITNQGIEQSLDAKLENAKRKLEQGNTNATKNILEAFINEVEAQGCSSYENCSTGKHLTSEAYALLKYNTQYLIDQLGGEKKKEDESKKE